MGTFRQRTVMAVIIAGAAGVGLSLGFLTSQDAKQVDDNTVVYEEPEAPSAAVPVQDPALAAELALLRARVDAMHKRLTQLGETDASASARDTGQQAGPANAPGESVNDALVQHMAQLAHRFRLESTDTSWADNVATEIQDAFVAGDIPASTSLVNVDCRSTLCKLDVSYQSSDGLAGVRNKLMEKVGAVLPYGAIHPGDSENTVSIYLGKQQETFAPSETPSP